MGRQTFQLDPHTIKSRRNELHFTQDYVAVQLHESLGKTSHERTAKSWLSMYQKIERTGKTSRKKAEKLADVLSISLETLKGEREIDYMEHMNAAILPRVAKLLESKDAAGLQRIAAFMGYKNVDDLGMQNIRDIALEIGKRIEAARLSSKRTDLDRLAAIFNIPRDQLLLPVVVTGFWWLTMSDAEGRVVSIFHSPVDLIEAIQQSWKDQRIFQMSHVATHLEVAKFGLKTRIEAQNHHTKNQGAWWCEYAKCDVHEDGVRFLPTQWWDELTIESCLKEFIYTAANRIDLFGQRIPEQPSKLFFRVSAYRQNPETWVMEAAGTRDLYGQQILEEMPLLLSESGYAAIDSAELLQLLNLGWGLKNSLHPFLKTEPAQAWKVEVDPGAIRIDVMPEKQRRGAALCGPAKRYIIRPMWRDHDNAEHFAPCRQYDLENLAKEIQGMVESDLPSWFNESDVLPFEPVPDS